MSEARGAKEIRFTRNAQAAHFFGLALCFLCVGIGLYLLSLEIWSVSREPLLKRSWYGLVVLPFVGVCVWVGMHLAKHAYMIFSPVGIELFPFFKPTKNMAVFYWSEIEDLQMTADGKMMEVTLISEGDHTNKVFVTTAPLRKASRALLVHTVERIREKREAGAAVGG